MLGLHCCVSFSLVAVNSGYSLVAVLRLLIAVASLVVEHRQALGHVGLSSYSPRAQKLQLPGPRAPAQ